MNGHIQDCFRKRTRAPDDEGEDGEDGANEGEEGANEGEEGANEGDLDFAGPESFEHQPSLKVWSGPIARSGIEQFVSVVLLWHACRICKRSRRNTVNIFWSASTTCVAIDLMTSCQRLFFGEPQPTCFGSSSNASWMDREEIEPLWNRVNIPPVRGVGCLCGGWGRGGGGGGGGSFDVHLCSGRAF